MFNSLKVSFKLDFTYAINSFIYHLQKTPLIKDVIPTNLYEKQHFKNFIRFLATVLTGLKIILFRLIYFLSILLISSLISKSTLKTFIHIYFIFCLIGMFINTTLITTSRKKYISIILFNMDAKKFLLGHYLLNSFINLIINIGFLLIIGRYFNLSSSLAITLGLFSFFSKSIGEACSLWYYRSNKTRLLTDKMTIAIMIGGFVISLLPYLNIYINTIIINNITLIFGLLALFAIIYIFKVDDYKLLYKRLTVLNASNDINNNDQSYLNTLVSINDRDIKIKDKKLKNKTGYNLFNTIFFERHKSILLRSARMYALIISIIVLSLLFMIIKYPHYKMMVYQFLINHIGWLVIIMYFINRGAIVTQAMFFSCDRAMLKFNFYRDPKTILELFKYRLVTLIKINLIPATVVALGFFLILAFTSNFQLSYLTIIIFTICLCIFFSVHYLVIYYLLQPYTQDMKLKSPIYSIISFITYFCCYLCTKINFNLTLFCLFGIAITVGYIIISLKLVGKKAPITFKIK